MENGASTSDDGAAKHWRSIVLSKTSEESRGDEPSLGRFLTSFVLLPGAIVLVCLSVVVGLRWLSDPGTNPRQLVDTIERADGNVRWRAAVRLAAMLADPEYTALREDPQVAGRLVELLYRELESGSVRKEDVMLKVFLCRALGEFNSDASLPVLVSATAPRRDPDVRRSAIEAIAVLADALGSERVRTESGLNDSLLAASRDGDPQVRMTAAYALGVLGGSQAEQRLAVMLLDENALVRYNAATGLARWGNVAAVDVLLEMLAPEQKELIQINALEAVSQLLKNNRDASADEIQGTVTRLKKITESRAVEEKAREVQNLISTRSP